MPRIEELLAQFPPEQRQARFIFDCGKDGYVVRALLALPTGNLAAGTETRLADPAAAIDEVVANLAAEIERHRVNC